MNENLQPLDFSHGIPTFANFENTIVAILMVAALVFLIFAFWRAVCDDQDCPGARSASPAVFTRNRIK